MTQLGANRYGKSAIRLVKVVRDGPSHRIRDLTVAIALEGEFASAHVEGDNSLVVATDTMKNTVYALAGEHLTGAVEEFAVVLGRRFLESDQVARAIVSIDEHAWSRIGDAPDAFVRDQASRRTAVVASERDSVSFEAGIADLTVMKSGKSAFFGFPRDEFTTLPDTDDRLMATRVNAAWRYAGPTDFDQAHEAIRSTLLEAFAEHESQSVQHTIWLVGRAIVERHPEVAEVTLTMPNLHHWLADLSPFGLPNDRSIFIPTTEPHGLIQGTIRRD
jgi:urate oxidase